MATLLGLDGGAVVITLAVRVPFARADFHAAADLSIFRRWIRVSPQDGLVAMY
jgi:hypothetical protein